jgi:hypothetical protein
MLSSHDCNSRFLYPTAHSFPRMTSQAWTIWKARWKRELNSRESIVDAFKAYRDLYGVEASIEVQNMAWADPKTSAELPKYPNFTMRSKTGPLLEEGAEKSAATSPLERDTAGMQHSVDSGARHAAGHMQPSREEQVAWHIEAGVGHVRRNHISAAGSIPPRKPIWPGLPSGLLAWTLRRAGAT